MQAYPREMRLAVLTARDSGEPTKQVAQKFGVSRSWVRRVVQQRRELGKLGPYRFRRRNRHGGSLYLRVKYMVIEDPQITVTELQRVLGVELSLELITSVKDDLDIGRRISWYGGLFSKLKPLPNGDFAILKPHFEFPKLQKSNQDTCDKEV